MGSEPDVPLIDEAMWQQLRASLSEGDCDPVPEVLREVVHRYAPTSAARLRDLRAQVQAGRLEEAAKLAHTVKGNGAMIGAARVVRLASALEQRLPRLPVVTAEVLAQVGELEHACAATAAELAARTAAPTHDEQ